MILTDHEGNKYWAHFRHYPEQITVRDLRTAFAISQWMKRGGVEFYISKKLMQKIASKRATRLVTFFVTQCGFHANPCPMKDRPKNTSCEGVKLVGTSVCSPLDIFLKPDGRKRALKRAIQDLPRELRQQLWESYRQQREAFGEYFKVTPRKRGNLRPLGR